MEIEGGKLEPAIGGWGWREMWATPCPDIRDPAATSGKGILPSDPEDVYMEAGFKLESLFRLHLGYVIWGKAGFPLQISFIASEKQR